MNTLIRAKNGKSGGMASGSARPAGLWHRLARYARYRLVIPLLRARHPAEYTARGVLVGVVCGLMPILGQSGIVLLVWLATRRLFNWHFSLVIAVLWTFISNPLTSPPMFYGFYMTGQAMLGQWQDLSGFDSFTALIHSFSSDSLSPWEHVREFLDTLFLDWALAMWVGFLPWAALCGWLGYRWSLKAVTAYRHMRQKRLATASQ
jgi:uncharacterized protein